MSNRFSWFNVTSIVLGFAFLYIPILLLIIYSFNESKLVTVWGGWSTKWYQGLLSNEGLMDAAWVTLRVGIISATLATILGTLAALVLTRMGKFNGRTIFSGLTPSDRKAQQALIPWLPTHSTWDLLSSQINWRRCRQAPKPLPWNESARSAITAMPC